MAYKLIDADGNEIILHDLQDKGPWCKSGESKEKVFIVKYGGQLDLKINPEKTKDAKYSLFPGRY